jgi:K(+)-stimulated pyrophosphate-energized sodium pump
LARRYGAFPLGTGNATIALFAVALAGTGLLTTVGVIVSMDTFGPVSTTLSASRR